MEGLHQLKPCSTPFLNQSGSLRHKLMQRASSNEIEMCALTWNEVKMSIEIEHAKVVVVVADRQASYELTKYYFRGEQHIETDTHK